MNEKVFLVAKCESKILDEKGIPYETYRKIEINEEGNLVIERDSTGEIYDEETYKRTGKFEVL